MAKQISIKTFPHQEGDETQIFDVDTLSPEQVFQEPYKIVVGGRVIHDWDEILEEVANAPDDRPFEITRFRPIVGG